MDFLRSGRKMSGAWKSEKELQLKNNILEAITVFGHKSLKWCDGTDKCKTKLIMG